MSGGSVLVTGSSGFIGGAVYRRFQELGFRTLGVGRQQLDRPDYISHDLTRPLPEDLGPFDIVVHAAARSSPWGSYRQFEANNVSATQLLLENCSRNGQPKIVFLSSSSVYYRCAHQYGISEADPPSPRPVNRYAASKIRAEELVRQYPGRWVILRPRAVFGPGDTVLFPRVLAAARARRLPHIVSPEGPVYGDLIYIENLVDTIVAAATGDGIEGEFNLTNNEPVPIMDFLCNVFARLSIPLPTGQITRRQAMVMAGGLEYMFAALMPWREPPITRFGVHVFAYSKTFNVRKMLAVFGPPRVTLETGVERFVQWIQSQEDEGNE